MHGKTQALRHLLKKGVPFQWTDETEKEFNDLKQIIISPNIMLYHPDWNTEFELHVDASKLGCGAMLAQMKDGILRPVRFASKAFSPAESRWSTMHQELLAVKWGLEHFRSYLLGRRVKVVTDHANLKWLTTIATQQAKGARWCMSMAEFDFYIEHKKGEKNIVLYVLSRYTVKDLPDYYPLVPPEEGVYSCPLDYVINKHDKPFVQVIRKYSLQNSLKSVWSCLESKRKTQELVKSKMSTECSLRTVPFSDRQLPVSSYQVTTCK